MTRRTLAVALALAVVSGACTGAHPDGDDVTACPLQLGTGTRIGFVPISFVVTPSMLRRKNGFGAGDDVFFIGRFIGRDGREQNTPTVRFGNIAMMPFEPIENPDTGISQQSFLVEMRSLPGYSGSPVFVYSPRVEVEVDLRKVRIISGTWAKGPAEGRIDPIHELFLLGVDWCHFKSFAPMLESDKKTRHADELFVAQNTGMAGVVPAWKLLDILFSEDLIEARKQQQQEHEHKSADVDLDSARPEPGQLTEEEFDAALQKSMRRRR